MDDLMPFAPLRPDELARPAFVDFAPEPPCAFCGPGGHYAHCPAGGCS